MVVPASVGRADGPSVSTLWARRRSPSSADGKTFVVSGRRCPRLRTAAALAAAGRPADRHAPSPTRPPRSSGTPSTPGAEAVRQPRRRAHVSTGPRDRPCPPTWPIRARSPRETPAIPRPARPGRAGELWLLSRGRFYRSVNFGCSFSAPVPKDPIFREMFFVTFGLGKAAPGASAPCHLRVRREGHVRRPVSRSTAARVGRGSTTTRTNGVFATGSSPATHASSDAFTWGLTGAASSTATQYRGPYCVSATNARCIGPGNGSDASHSPPPCRRGARARGSARSCSAGAAAAHRDQRRPARADRRRRARS